MSISPLVYRAQSEHTIVVVFDSTLVKLTDINPIHLLHTKAIFKSNLCRQCHEDQAKQNGSIHFLEVEATQRSHATASLAISGYKAITDFPGIQSPAQIDYIDLSQLTNQLAKKKKSNSGKLKDRIFPLGLTQLIAPIYDTNYMAEKINEHD